MVVGGKELAAKNCLVLFFSCGKWRKEGRKERKKRKKAKKKTRRDRRGRIKGLGKG